MNRNCVINVDLADVWAQPGRKELKHTLAWGDNVVVTNETAERLTVETVSFDQQSDGSILPSAVVGYIEPPRSGGIRLADVVRPSEQNEVLKVNFVDVNQGDASVIESPDGPIILVDGGENAMFARYLAGRYRGTTSTAPKQIDCIVVTHGDADHFAGLTEILKSETNPKRRKRLFIQPLRYYHNGIVKRPTEINKKAVPDAEQLGPTAKVGGEVILTGLVENLLDVPDGEMNDPFRQWKAALQEYNDRVRDPKIEFRRIESGDRSAFAFFNNAARDLRIEVLGPLMTEKNGVRGLKFLGNPPAGPRIGHESLDTSIGGFKGLSAAHTINGHSIVFRLVYGGFSYLFTGDINDEASRLLVEAHNAGRINLKADIYKAGHHGTADFSGAFLKAVSPLVNVISSGDESERVEYIHPRATLMGALGQYSSAPEPLIFVTELIAFFKVEGWSQLAEPKTQAQKGRGDFFGFSRACYGLVKTRTNGKRLLVYTDSGNIKLKEAYAYILDASGQPQPSPVVRI